MCLSIPYQIIEIKNKKALVKMGKTRTRLDIRLLTNLKKGDWVLAENGFAVAKVSRKEVNETLKLIS